MAARRVLVLAALSLAGCGHDPTAPVTPGSATAGSAAGSAAGATTGARKAEADTFCEAPLPVAYDFPDEATARAAGCSAKRVYGTTIDEHTGAERDRELWFYCCPR